MVELFFHYKFYENTNQVVDQIYKQVFMIDIASEFLVFLPSKYNKLHLIRYVGFILQIIVLVIIEFYNFSLQKLKANAFEDHIEKVLSFQSKRSNDYILLPVDRLDNAKHNKESKYKKKSC